MPPIKFRLNLTYGLGGAVVWRISRWPPWRPPWILEWNHFSNSESLCHYDAFHQVSAQSDRVWNEMLFEEFQDGCHGGHLGYWNGTILAILNLHVPTMLSTKFQLNPIYDSGGDVKHVKSSRWAKNISICHLLKFLPTSESSNQPAHLHSLTGVFLVHMKKLCILGFSKCALWRFWSDCMNAQADLNLQWMLSNKVCVIIILCILENNIN